jgi:hypothetical protein
VSYELLKIAIGAPQEVPKDNYTNPSPLQQVIEITGVTELNLEAVTLVEMHARRNKPLRRLTIHMPKQLKAPTHFGPSAQSWSRRERPHKLNSSIGTNATAHKIKLITRARTTVVFIG